MKQFVHFTNSTLLIGLAKTNNVMFGLQDLLLKHEFAPFCGEVSEGTYGINIPMNTAFGSFGDNQFKCSWRYANYSQINTSGYPRNETQFANSMEDLLNSHPSLVWSRLTSLLRAVQMGVMIKIPTELVDETKKMVEEVRDEHLKSHAVDQAASKIINEQYQLIMKVIFEPEQFELSDAEKAMVENPFPIALFKGDGCNLYHLNGAEYRATKPAVLGEDIIAVATTARHGEQLGKYLQEHGLADRVEVNIIEDMMLQHAAQTRDNTMNDVLKYINCADDLFEFLRFCSDDQKVNLINRVLALTDRDTVFGYTPLTRLIQTEAHLIQLLSFYETKHWNNVFDPEPTGVWDHKQRTHLPTLIQTQEGYAALMAMTGQFGQSSWYVKECYQENSACRAATELARHEQAKHEHRTTQIAKAKSVAKAPFRAVKKGCIGMKGLIGRTLYGRSLAPVQPDEQIAVKSTSSSAPASSAF